MSISIPGVGLREIPCVGAVGSTAQAQLETVSDGAGKKPQLSPSNPGLHQPFQPSAESHKSSRFLSYGISVGILSQDMRFSTKEPQTLPKWQSGFRARLLLSQVQNLYLTPLNSTGLCALGTDGSFCLAGGICAV